MSDEQPIILMSQTGRVATITLNRPKALNAITAEMLTLLGTTLDGAAADDSVGVIILTGAGRAFSAGVDLKALAARPTALGDAGDVLNTPARAAIHRLTTIPKIVIAKINGFCFTGGLELALGCDLIVAADEAKLADTHAKWGLRPTWGMSQRLVRLIGPTRARELSYTARTFTGAEAAAWGLATQSAPLAQLDGVVAELAEAILANSAGSVAAYKDLYGHALDTTLDAGLAYEAGTTYQITDAGGRLATFG
jgi:enoyl-CoA hydratase